MCAHLVEITNAFEPSKTKRTVIRGNVTVLQAIKQVYPRWKNFKQATICLVEGRPLMRAEWDKYIIPEDGVVNFIAQPGDYVTALYWLYGLLIVATVTIALSMPKPALNGAPPEPDPVFSLAGQRNQIRLGSAIEVPYGFCRLWPSYAAKAYNKYINNDQYQYQLFCLGQGEYEIDRHQIEDTLLGNFQDVTLEVYQPGDAVTLFPDNVITSTEVGGIELFGSNETAFAGVSGPFTANPPGVANKTTHLEIDVSFPAGLYKADNSGALQNETVTALFEYRQIDDAGAPIGGWLTLANFSKTLRTNTPQRFTLEKDVISGRYEVRGSRTNAKDTDSRSANTLRWEIMRAFLPSTKDYGNVTLVAIKAKASNNLNDRAANRYNVWATRKLRIWDGDAWTALTATRSIVWAFVDLFQAQYGGQLPDSQINLVDMLALDAIYTEKGWNFDFVFDQSATVWESARIIARNGRAVPMLVGPQVTMIRDYEKTLPVAVFNQENIIAGSFKHDLKLATDDEFTGLQVEYTDPNTFLPETVDCLIDDDTTDDLEQIKFPGCTDRKHAYTEGLYMRRQKLLLRENVTFSTGLEGMIPTYGDLIKVAHDLMGPNRQGGFLIGLSGDNLTLQLSEPVTFGAGTHRIALNKKDGSQAGPFVCTAGADPTLVVLSAPLVPTDYNFETIKEFARFIFGKTDEDGVLVVVVSLAPSDAGTVEIKGYIKDDSVFDGDAIDPPDLPPVLMPPPAPTVPVLNCATLKSEASTTDSNTSTLSWAAALGAKSYNVQISNNGTDWVDAGNTEFTSLVVSSTPELPLHFRVQPVGGGTGLAGGAGAWCIGSNSGDPAPRSKTDTLGGDRYEKLPQDDVADSHLPFRVDCIGKRGYGCLCGFPPFIFDAGGPGGDGTGPWVNDTSSQTDDSHRRFRKKTVKVGDGGYNHCTFVKPTFVDCGSPACGGSASIEDSGIIVGYEFEGNFTYVGSLVKSGTSGGSTIYTAHAAATKEAACSTPPHTAPCPLGAQIAVTFSSSTHVLNDGDTILIPTGLICSVAGVIYDGSFLGTPHGTTVCMLSGAPDVSSISDWWDTTDQYSASTCALVQTGTTFRLSGPAPACGPPYSTTHGPILNGIGLCSSPTNCYTSDGIIGVYDAEQPGHDSPNVKTVPRADSPLEGGDKTIVESIVVRRTIAGPTCEEQTEAFFKGTGYVVETLSEEDTVEDAMKRYNGGQAFMDISNDSMEAGSICAPDCCRTYISLRTGAGGGCFFFRQAKGRLVVAPGLMTVGQAYQFKVYYYRRPFGAGTFTPHMVDFYNHTANATDFATGYTSLWFEIPVEDGFEITLYKASVNLYP